MDDAYSVDAMQDKALKRADVGRMDSVMVARIGVGDAAAAGGNRRIPPKSGSR